MNGCKLKTTDEEMDDMFEDIDEDGSGTIDIDEFLGLMSRKSIGIDLEIEMRQVFRVFDRNGDGGVEFPELRSLLKAINPRKFGDVEDEVFQAVMKVVDSDGDGSISYEEFVRALISKK